MDEPIQENDTLQNELDNYESLNVVENETPIENEGTEDLEALKKENQTLKVQKGLYKTKYEELKSKLPTSPEPKKMEATPAYDPIELIKLSKAINGYSEDEIDFITKFSKSSKPTDIIAAASDPWVQTAISAKREKLEKDNKIPSPSSPTMSVTSAPNRNLSDEDLEKATREAFEKSNLKSKGVGA